MLARYPAYAPSDAVSLIARDRKLVRGIGETQAAFAVRLAAWLDRARARPAVGQTVDEMTEVFAKLPDFPTLIAQGKVKRQYRDHRLEWMLRSGGIDVLQAGLAAGNIRFSHELK